MTMAVGLPETASRLQADAEEERFCIGAQAFVSFRGDVVLDAGFGRDGLGRPMTAETLSAVYCTIKPAIAVLVLLLVQDGVLRQDLTLGEVLELDDNPELGAVRLDDLLSHRAGMHTLRSVVTAAAPPTLRHELAMAATPAEGWDRRTDGAYSEWLGFYLIGQVIERVTGVELADLLRERVLEPLGIDDEMSLGLEQEELGRVGVNIDLRGGSAVPLLMERAPWFAGERDPSLNAFATMRALGRFYEWVLATLDGRRSDPLEPQRLREACLPHRPVVHDQILGLQADWGLGFMTGLGRLGFGPYPSQRAVGHTGQVGTSIAFCDPEHGLAVAVLYNGVIEQSVGIGVRRPAVVAAVYKELGIEAASIGLSELEAAAIHGKVSSV